MNFMQLDMASWWHLCCSWAILEAADLQHPSSGPAADSPSVLAGQLLHRLCQLRRDAVIAWQQLDVCAARVGAHGPAQRLGTSLADGIVVQPQPPQAAACEAGSQSRSTIITCIAAKGVCVE